MQTQGQLFEGEREISCGLKIEIGGAEGGPEASSAPDGYISHPLTGLSVAGRPQQPHAQLEVCPITSNARQAIPFRPAPSPLLPLGFKNLHEGSTAAQR